MKKGQIYRGIVMDSEFPNKGIVTVTAIETENGVEEMQHDTSVIVKNALCGQFIRFRINKLRKGRTEACLLEVLQAASCERISPCPHFGQCGGCLYQSFSYTKQLQVKELQITKLLKPVCDDAGVRYQNPVEFDTIFEGIKESPVEFGYRNKMEFSFGDEYLNGPISIGMHKRGSFYDVVYVPDCQIVDEDYRRILRFTKEFFEKSGLTYFHRVRHTGFLRHLLVRKASKTGEILVAIVTSSQENYSLQEYANGLMALPYDGVLVGIIHTINDNIADTVKDEGSTVLFGREYFYEELLGLKFRITQFSFFQTNSLGAEVLYETVRDFLGKFDKKEPVVYDLYSGTGTIAQLVAPVAGKVVGVEIVEEAVTAAKENAQLNGLTNCEFLAGDVLKVLDEIKERPDYIVLDPPREGIHPKALTKIIRYGVDRIVYVSCKPSSLARDLEVFLGNGYTVKRICCVDMFPATANIETVVLLEKQ